MLATGLATGLAFAAAFTVFGEGKRYTGPLDRAIAQALLEEQGLVVDPGSPIHWVTPPGRPSSPLPWATTEALLLARTSQTAPRDLYWLRVRVSSDHTLSGLGSVHNLTRTSVADERGLTGLGARLAWHVGSVDRVYRVEYADLRGPPAADSDSWGAIARLQRRLTQWQETGQMSPILRRSFKLEPTAAHVQTVFSDSSFSIRADAQLTTLPRNPSLAVEGAHHIIEQPRIAARPSTLLPWAVDRLRAFEWFGSDRMQWVKAVVYRGLDWLDQRRETQPSLVWDQASDLGVIASPGVGASTTAAHPPDWPPPSLSTVVEPPLEGEGQWRSLSEDAFVRQSPGLPAPFTTTYVRPDALRPDSRVVIVLWDPKRVRLGFAAGTREPRSATGEIGSGLIPRDATSLPRLLGAFNGGFQTSHGNWGAQVDHKLYVPPQPYAATVAEYEDGAIGFGTWPLDTRVPDNIRGFRQNLTPLIANSAFNPYQRTWWGGVPDGWKDDTRTVRSGLCQTEANRVAYFYGVRVDHEHLARAMQLAHCQYAMHLDMNSGHTGFEFYNVTPHLIPLPPASLDKQWRTEGEIPELPQFRFRARRLIREMPLMNFPRYIHRQTRDFFYLLERPGLQRTKLKSAFPNASEEGHWRFPATAQHGYPQVLATTWLRPDSTRPATKVRVLQLDLSWLVATRPASGAPTADPSTVLSVLRPRADAPSESSRVLWVQRHKGSISTQVPPNAVVLARERPPLTSSSSRAAWGMVGTALAVYAEVVTGPSATLDDQLLETVLQDFGCTSMIQTDSSRPALGGVTDLSGHPIGELSIPRTRLLRQDWQASRPLFPETEIVGPGIWYDLQH